MSPPNLSQAANVPVQPAPGGEFCFRLLGDVQVSCAEQVCSDLPHRVHGLLAALLLRPKPLRREYLAGLLFPDASEQSGRSRLSDLLWLLRRSLPVLPLEADSPQAIFLPPHVRWLDVEAFRQAADQDNLELWLAALTLYRGNLLERLYDDWLVEERESLYLQYVHLSHRTCNKLIHQQRYDQVLPIAERLVQAEPYDESALRNLMKVYRELGRRGAALAAYDRFLTLSADGLGIEPEAATQTLAQSLRSENVTVLPTVPPSLADSSPESLLHQARQAAVCSDALTLQSLIERLRTLPAIDVQEIFLLEIDLALSAEEFERAAQLLESSQPHAAPLLLRQAQLACHLRQAGEAQEKASEVLILAHDSGDSWSELNALLVLSQAQRLAGLGVQSARSAEKALKLGHTMGSPAHICQALKSKGYTLYRQGRSSEALSILQEMHSLAQEHGLRSAVAEALRGISTIYSDRFAWRDAMLANQEELSIWRDLGLRRREAQTLHNLAIVKAQLGCYTECLRILENARQICEQLGDPVELAINQYNIADTLIDYDEANAPQAIALINQALDTFRSRQQPAWEAASLTTLGFALWNQGQHQSALDAFRRSYHLYEQMGEMPFLPEMLAYQALAHLGLGQREQALALSRQGVISLVQGEGFEETTLTIYYAHAQALEANGQPEQARVYLERAYQRLLSGAAQLEDEPARQAFFTLHPIVRRVMQQVYTYGIAPAPSAGVITRRVSALQAKSTLPVRLTLDAGPADAAIKASQGAVGLRRARLARLLDEARAQGARLTQHQLAEILDVNLRTIKRDMAALRRA